MGMNLWRLGMHADAERELHEAEAASPGLGLTGVLRTVSLVGVLLDRGQHREACVLAGQHVEKARAAGFSANEGRARWSYADVLCASGDLEASDREYTAALALLVGAPLDRAGALATRGRLRLEQGRAAEALADVTEGLDFLTAHGAPAFRGEYARLVHAQALRSTGDVPGSLRAIAAARDRILAQADKIDDPIVRAAFLGNVYENRRTLELCEAWRDG
jgi:hypothetical protein